MHSIDLERMQLFKQYAFSVLLQFSDLGTCTQMSKQQIHCNITANSVGNKTNCLQQRHVLS